MKKSIILRWLFVFVCLFSCVLLKGQDANPFKSIGKKAHVLTLSRGKYVEVIENDSIQRVGCVLINMRTETIVGFLNEDSLQEKSTDNSEQSRWYQQDPLMEEYYDYSPYNFALNNPVNFTDPDGMKVVKNGDDGYTITGDDIYTYYGYLNTVSSGQGSMSNLFAGLSNASSQNDGGGGDMTGTLQGVTSVGRGTQTLNYAGSRSDPGFWGNLANSQTTREPYSGFWGVLGYLWTNGNYGGYRYDIYGRPTGRSPVMGLPPDVSMSGPGNLNAVYKGLKGGIPYIGKSFNILKRYTQAEREAMRIKSMFSDISDPKLLRAIEQVVLEYQKSLGGVSNANKAMDFELTKHAGYYQKAIEYLETNHPNWQQVVAETLK